MNGKNINFDNKNIKKSDFYNKNKKIFNIDDIDVNKILVSKKEQYGDVIRQLYLGLSQMTGYINKFDENKITMSLMVKDKQLLKNYKKIWKKRLMGTDFESNATYDDKYINTKIKTYKNSITTNI